VKWQALLSFYCPRVLAATRCYSTQRRSEHGYPWCGQRSETEVWPHIFDVKQTVAALDAYRLLSCYT